MGGRTQLGMGCLNSYPSRGAEHRLHEPLMGDPRVRPQPELVVLTTDAKGIVMRQEDLRDATRAKAEAQTHKLDKRLCRRKAAGQTDGPSCNWGSPHANAGRSACSACTYQPRASGAFGRWADPVPFEAPWSDGTSSVVFLSLG